MSNFSISVRTPFFVPAKKLLLSKKFKIFLNYFVGPVIFIWLSFSIYSQVQQHSDVHQSWTFIKASFTGPQSWKLVLAVLLMALNWSMEARKWQLLVGHIQQVSFKRACSAVLSGQALAFNTPNRVGESVGRAVYLAEGKRLKGITLSVVGSMSQLLVTFVMGLLALLFLHINVFTVTDYPAGVSLFWYNGFILIITIGTGLFVLLYYRLSWVIKRLERIPVIAKYRFLVEELENFGWKELTGILLLSTGRYVVCMVQYVLLLQVFGVEVSVINAVSMIGVMFLVMAVVPTIALAELGFRGKISLQLFGLLSSNTVGIIATIAGIWIINLIVPAIIGSLLLLRVRLFRNKKE